MREKADVLLKDIYAAFGWKTRLIAPLLGRFAWSSLLREEARLADGWTYEPRSFCEKNAAAQALEKAGPAKGKVAAEREVRARIHQPAETFGK
jgi:hypothetical protein